MNDRELLARAITEAGDARRPDRPGPSSSAGPTDLDTFCPVCHGRCEPGDRVVTLLGRGGRARSHRGCLTNRIIDQYR